MAGGSDEKEDCKVGFGSMVEMCCFDLREDSSRGSCLILEVSSPGQTKESEEEVEGSLVAVTSSGGMEWKRCKGSWRDWMVKMKTESSVW